MRVIDLSMPIGEGHLRWPVSHEIKGNFAAGDLFQVSWLRTSCHGFTHVDAPRHMVPGGATLDDLELGRVVGPAAVIDLSDVQPDEEIGPERLAGRAGHLKPGEIALFRSCWDEQRDWRTEAFWREAPYLSRDACEWLLAREITAAAFDFPQDWTIRRLLDGEVRPIHEHVSHDVLLRKNVTLIEYLAGTRALKAERVLLVAAPLRLTGADGALARVVAIEGLLD
ncbi:MAG: cyclase family protein [Xanthomonadales bacterium]|nr:cyclase family protein [Xanthomonadales bacterium]